MQVPLSYADAVIGVSGVNISYVRRTSGATIAIEETKGVPGEMTVEINGSVSQVQTAQQLIQVFFESLDIFSVYNFALSLLVLALICLVMAFGCWLIVSTGIFHALTM